MLSLYPGGRQDHIKQLNLFVNVHGIIPLASHARRYTTANITRQRLHSLELSLPDVLRRRK